MLGNLPIGIVTDEAVRLAKMFGSDNASRFVNGVLGGLFRNEERLRAMLEAEIPPEELDEDYYDDEDSDL
jgi:hypothetical protein